MSLYTGLTGEPLNLVQENRTVLDRLPRTFVASTVVELQKWATLFEPERAYFRALANQLRALGDSNLQELFGGLAQLESRTGCDQVKAADAEEFQARALAYLQKRGQYANWRREIDNVFQKLEPRVEERLYSSDSRTRLVVILYGDGIAIERDKLWKRFEKTGRRIPLALDGAEAAEQFLAALFTGRGATAEAPRTLFDIVRQSGNGSPLDAWLIEAGDALHTLSEKGALHSSSAQYATGLSYSRLAEYRQKLTDAIYAKVLSGLRSPLELAAYFKTLEIRPNEGLTLYSDSLVLAFIRDIFLTGNGTLIINNTFVEWAAVRALRRAQPRVLVARFGVRDKMKPFSSLLLFSKPRPTDQIPILQDPLGSFIDAELLAYYIWLNAESAPPYRGRTLYLLLAEGVDEMVAVGPGARAPVAKLNAAPTLADVAVTMAHWLGVEIPGSEGRVIKGLVS